MMLSQRRRSTVSGGASSPIRDRTKRTNSMDKHTSARNMITEQLLPNPTGIARERSAGILKGEIDDINLRALLLPPWPGDAPPFAKSLIDLRSRTGSIYVELNRLPGAAHHFFQLSAISEESNVSIVLPSDFQGAVSINQGESRRGRVRWSSNFDDRLRSGAIRMEPSQVHENEDEVFVLAPGYVELCMMDELCSSASGGKTSVWKSIDTPHSSVQRLKRLLSFA
ncbi:hypothetical protein PC9H_001462 [Pleurotus ostreatus]|uniref:DUF7330 domain-containing protein n=1 Tax=Pleurotus ostreatus TaxID=5322 RepID=A0A8H7DYQ6_PLEOS|nr:uncharacterized protein PC9H_001462 [Pleurotus ostreatus]KAF7441113.1 hypothetical protein PC9H_001462 [Pleurotus ostreatus]KAJ8699399.1 hypothetical protein PTI98_002518 [Pleurotus ostreatus]